MDFNLNHDQQKLIQKSKEFAQKYISPNIKQLEDDLAFRQQLFANMGKEGFFTLNTPADKGGHRVDAVGYFLALAEISKIEAGIAVSITVTNMVAEAIVGYGTPEQIKKYIPKIANGSSVPMSFALTEKNAGSDAKSIETTAKKDGDFYILDGEKALITNADISGMTVVMAKVKTTDGSHGISAFLVDKGTPGFTILNKETKLGLLTANLVNFKLENCRIPASQLLGKEGEGLRIALGALDSGRLGVAAQSLGISEAAFEAATSYSKHRKQFGKPISDQQAIAFKLADMQVKISASRLLLLKAAWLLDQGKPYTVEASEAKLFGSEAANWIADEALQIHGGYGYTKQYPVEKYFRDARVTRIYEGTSEIQRLVISRHILKDS